MNMNYLHVNKESNYNGGSFNSNNGDSVNTLQPPNDINRTKSISRSLRSLFGRSNGHSKKPKPRDVSTETNPHYPMQANPQGTEFSEKIRFKFLIFGKFKMKRT